MHDRTLSSTFQHMKFHEVHCGQHHTMTAQLTLFWSIMLTTASNDYPEDHHSMMSGRLPSNISLETPISPTSGQDIDSNFSFISKSRQNMRSVSQAQILYGDNRGLPKKRSMYDVTQQFKRSRTSLLRNSQWPPRSASSYNI